MGLLKAPHWRACPLHRSKADVLYLKEIFDKHDQDHNGKVTVAELIQALSVDKKLAHQELSAFRVGGGRVRHHAKSHTAVRGEVY